MRLSAAEGARLLREGDLFRLTELADELDFEAWQLVSPEKDESLVSLVLTRPRANAKPLHLRLKGLDPSARYSLLRYDVFDAFQPEAPEEQPKEYTGAALLYGGLTLPRMMGDYPSVQIYLKKTKEGTPCCPAIP